MKAKPAFSQKQIEALIEDAAYLQNEADALQYVIDEVPYDESPPEGRSIAEILLLLDHAQLHYYRPVLEQAAKNGEAVNLSTFESFKDTFKVDPKKIEDIQTLLAKLGKHRAGVINVISNIELTYWSTITYNYDREFTLYAFTQEMIRHDRIQLKKIAQLVLAFSQEKQSKRELDRHREQRNRQSQ